MIMSWFDASGIASLAKNALKEAQKTIDKALDIKEDEQRLDSRDTAIETATDDFFATWGLKASAEKEVTDTSSDTTTETPKHKESPKGSSKSNMSTSLWGSFTGSFFENPKTSEGNVGDLTSDTSDPVSMQPKRGGLIRTSSLKHDSRNKDASTAAKKRKKSWDQGEVFSTVESDDTAALCDDASELRSNEGFSRSKLVVESDDPDVDVECFVLDPKSVAGKNDTADGDENSAVVTQRRELSSTSSFKHNRLSVISSESDKKSSESVEVIGSECGSSFTTSPDSEVGLMSPDMSAASSVTGHQSCATTSSPESVEVIPDTASSVEVLCEASSGRTSRTTSSPYISPESAIAPCSYAATFGDLQSPVEIPQVKSGETSEKTSPESVEVIPEEDEESVADDSYTSASESTATAIVTIMESAGRQFPVIQTQPTCDSVLPCASRAESASEIPVATHTGCRVGLQLALVPHTTEPLVSTGGTSSDILRPSVLLPPTPLPKDKAIEVTSATEDGSSGSTLSDSRTLKSTDSSGDGTLLDSSMEDATVSTSMPQQQSSSYYVKTMLADAMGEDENRAALITRDQSPISSESRSDLVKVESEQTSGHTSGDELETTTSSDIEIISSPNGDSSSTHSRHSPAKLLQRAARGKLALAAGEHECASSPSSENKFSVIPKSKGHQRELSETSSGGSDDSHCQEVEKLLKRVADITEILESRESKLIEISRLNIELQEHNSELKRQLEAALQSSVSESQDIHQVTEEYTQRLSSLERKFQQAIRDKETLRKQLEQARQDAASRLSKSELEGLVAEKDEVIRELREEGEKLSKQQLQYSNIIKKLRVKEKESDSTIKNQKEQLEELSQEVERLKRSLAAKEEVERTQIEAVHQLTARTKNQEKEIAVLHSQIEDMSQKVETLSVSLEAASTEMTESKKALMLKEEELSKAMQGIENMAQQELESALEEAKRNSQDQEQQLNFTIEDLRHRLRQTEEEHSGRDAALRQETAELLRRLETAEARSEELAEAASGATRPLLRQLEQLQATAASRQATFEKQERALSETISEMQGRMSAITEQERLSREQNISLHSQVSALELRLSSTNAELIQLQDELRCQQKLYAQLRSERDKEQHTSETLQETVAEEMRDLQRQIISLEQQLSIERIATEAEKRKTAILQDQLRDRDATIEKERASVRVSSPLGTPRSSPTLSFGRMSLSESVSSATWPQFPDEVFDTASNSGRLGNIYDLLRSGNTTSLLEGLQAQLKLRDGEVQQLQWELSRRDAERAALTAEVSALIARIEEQEVALSSAQEIRTQFEDIQHKYDALLQMYGEKVEETQELKLDLQDVKEMYKSQIDQLLKKESPS